MTSIFATSRTLLFLAGFMIPALCGAVKMNDILENSTSPDGKFELLVTTIPDSEMADAPAEERPKPGDAVSLFLLRKKGHRVVREIDPVFRSDNTRTDESYSTFWSRGSDKLAALYATPRAKHIVVFQLVRGMWTKLALPEFDWKAALREWADKEKLPAGEIGGTIMEIKFEKGKVMVNINAKIKGDSELSVEVNYSYRLKGAEWVAGLDSATLLKP